MKQFLLTVLLCVLGHIYLFGQDKIAYADNEIQDSIVGLNSNVDQLLHIGDSSAAKELLESILVLSESTTCSNCYYESLNRLASFHASRSEFPYALDYLLRAAGYAELRKDTLLEAQYFWKLGELYQSWNVDSKATEYSQKAFDLFRILNTDRLHLYAFDLAKGYQRIRQDSLASVYYDFALRNGDRQWSFEEKSYLLRQLSDIAIKQGDQNEAIRYEAENLRLKRSNQNQQGVLKSLNNLGVMYQEMQNYDTSLAYFTAALDLVEELGLANEKAVIQTNIGVIYEYKESFKLALRYIKEGLSYYEIVGDDWAAGQSHNYLASIYLLTGNWQKATHHSKEAIKLADDDPSIRNSSYQILANIYEAQGNSDLSRKYEQLAYEAKSEQLSQTDANSESIDSTMQAIAEKEEAIRVLMMDQQIRELSIEKLRLETDKKENSIELLQQQNALKQLELQQESLKKERARQQLELIKNQLRTEKQQGKIKELENEQSRLALEIRQRELNEAIKQQEIDQLATENKLRVLELRERTADLERQDFIRKIILAGAVFIILVGWLVFRSTRLRQKERNNRLERQRIELEQRLLRSQMNPHFIYNAMSSIQGFIIENKVKEAELYLAKFGKLLRNILEQSREPLISVDEEIVTIQLYLELEQLRFDNKFEYLLDVDSNIDREVVGIPPMILQPYLENAIQHGILPLPKSVLGQLNVKFKITDKVLYCEIEDNGIGREQSTINKSNAAQQHHSLGMEVTKERLQFMDEQFHQHVGVEIVDLEEKGKSIGTRIKLKIPYQEVL